MIGILSEDETKLAVDVIKQHSSVEDAAVADGSVVIKSTNIKELEEWLENQNLSLIYSGDGAVYVGSTVDEAALGLAAKAAGAGAKAAAKATLAATKAIGGLADAGIKAAGSLMGSEDGEEASEEMEAMADEAEDAGSAEGEIADAIASMDVSEVPAEPRSAEEVPDEESGDGTIRDALKSEFGSELDNETIDRIASALAK